jgi:hypothetical protein
LNRRGKPFQPGVRYYLQEQVLASGTDSQDSMETIIIWGGLNPLALENYTFLTPRVQTRKANVYADFKAESARFF